MQVVEPEVEGESPREQPGGSSARRRRESVEALVHRALGPAIGLALRVLDPFRSDPAAADRAREVATEAVRAVGTRHPGSDDDTVRAVLRRTARRALDELAGSPGFVPWPSAVDPASVLPEDAPLGSVAPSGRLGLADLQDATAPMRAADREVAYVVLGAGIAPGDAAVLLGRSSAGVQASLRRIGRRIAEGHLPAATDPGA